MNPLSMAELGILDWIQLHCRNGFWDAVMLFFTSLGDNGLIWILLGVLLLVFVKNARSTGAQLLLSLVFSLILCNLILKHAVDRIRPCDLNTAVELLVHRPRDPSFPSGHTSASFAVVTVLLLNRWKGGWAALVLAILIAFSRLYLYVHFPTDVLGGLLTGMVSGWLAVTLWRKGAAARMAREQKHTP